MFPFAPTEQLKLKKPSLRPEQEKEQLARASPPNRADIVHFSEGGVRYLVMVSLLNDVATLTIARVAQGCTSAATAAVPGWHR